MKFLKAVKRKSWVGNGVARSLLILPGTFFAPLRGKCANSSAKESEKNGLVDGHVKMSWKCPPFLKNVHQLKFHISVKIIVNSRQISQNVKLSPSYSPIKIQETIFAVIFLARVNGLTNNANGNSIRQNLMIGSDIPDQNHWSTQIEYVHYLIWFLTSVIWTH